MLPHCNDSITCNDVICKSLFYHPSVLDYTPYLVQDTATEKQYNFSLRKSIEKASEKSVLDGYKIHVTKSVKPDPPQMEGRNNKIQ